MTTEDKILKDWEKVLSKEINLTPREKKIMTEFISKALQQQREEIIEEIEGMVIDVVGNSAKTQDQIINNLKNK
ncbi:MAG: hypothetical protein GY861_18225 [bacterium]|nr:hypothetical protein [bacterium]